MLEQSFADIWIIGEVSNFRAYPSGHLYFGLKDEKSQIDAVCFRSAARLLKFELEDGLAVVGHGRLDLYAPRGKYQVVLDYVEPKGLGALQLAFEKLKKKLEQEGLFREERKKSLPVLPRVLGIVTSPAGAAIHDMLRTLRLHRARMKVLLYPARVQGDGAGAQIAEGVRYLNSRGDIDVIIVGRGGGSIEDLWSFNEEVVARAIADSRVPVVSGVGHEIDFTIADFVADKRAATPTAAAQLVAKGWEELADRLRKAGEGLVENLEQALLDYEQRLEELVRHRAFELVRGKLVEARYRIEKLVSSAEMSLRAGLKDRSSSLNHLKERLMRRHPVENLLRQRARLHQLIDRADRRVEATVEQRCGRFGKASAKLEALSPLASLGRGYSICRKEDGTVVSRIGQVVKGERVDVRVSDGDIGCKVLESNTQDSGGQ